MASKKQHAAIDFQGAAKITIGSAAGTSGQVLTSGGSGAMTWADGGTPAAGVVNEINSLTTDGSCGLTINYTRNGSTTSKFVTITGCGGGS
jgi:hypothetical protein